ncbi:precorrin-3B C(17)-methyltransferase [Pseudoroseicyclus tamaricis]|uniref:Precorrin-3B C(17)-methyltransferase n=1 Tax=Pseudoroseicyclus tamaricis TaxID=2705421 RepID=A0A6B2JN47_9RHOB|nr:precorrin-3B C(17)-methyltransferase [Pseudoroseicyclus tamaricis]NDU99437.1 precorrin-3B C(17)-methyltransferase [Pseudoroseicyclus tamaricis]
MALTPAILALTDTPLARQLAEALDGEVHALAGRATGDVAVTDVPEHVRSLFAAGRPIVGLCAAGILIRAVAPLLADKRAEPPVLAVAEDGSSVTPLLGGHHGANDLARRIAEAFGIAPALTTAGDVRLGLSLDAPPEGWRLANPEAAKPAMAALLAGGGATISGGAPWLATLPAGPEVAIHAGLAPAPEGALAFHPARVVLGAGCARNCPPEELIALAEEALAEATIAPGAVAAIATLDLKADEPAMHALAAHLGAPLRLFDASALEAESPRAATPSDVVFAEVGTHGVSENAALASVGAEGQLLLPKRKSANATVALGLAPAPLTALPGRARGQVSLIGIGPGQPAWRTPEASRLVAEAEELVGYSLYIDLLGPLAHGKPRADFPLGGEEDRCRHALERAGEGRNVALVCSGDSGIYAMGALVWELIARGDGPGGVSDAARRAAVVSAPGITAMQAASARAGALLGHDFCAISLSDLLTPREAIRGRLKAAAEGDFVIAFYNPVSKTRRTLLAEAREILLAHRPADTPVLLASSLGRPEETLRHRRLDELEVDEVDMLTTVLIGSSASRLVQTGDGPRIFTPRGYEKHLIARAAE